MTTDPDAARRAALSPLIDFLAHPVRRQILAALDRSEHSAGTLRALVGKRQNFVSNHLALMRLRAVVTYTRTGGTNAYRLTALGREAHVILADLETIHEPAPTPHPGVPMSTDLATIPTTAYAPPALDFLEPLPLGHADVLRAFLEGRKASTLRSYSYDLADFAKFLEAANTGAGISLLLSLPHGHANACVFRYRAALVARGMKAATIARRLAALRSVVKMGRTLGVIPWTLDVESPKVVAYRDTRGPGDEGWKLMLAEAIRTAATGNVVAIRDLAIIRLPHDLALRRGECTALDRSDVDLADSAVYVLGKGHTDKVRMTLPRSTRDALAAWLAVHPAASGPLFVRLDPGAGMTPERLTGQSVWEIVRDLGKKVGLSRPVWPHGLRHLSITKALNKTNGNYRKVKDHSRHVNVQTVVRYDDNRLDHAGEVACLVAEDDD